MRWGYSAFAASLVMGSGPLQLVFHSVIPYQETPTNHFKFVGRGKKEYVARHLAQFTGEGEQGHVSPNTGAP